MHKWEKNWGPSMASQTGWHWAKPKGNRLGLSWGRCWDLLMVSKSAYGLERSSGNFYHTESVFWHQFVRWTRCNGVNVGLIAHWGSLPKKLLFKIRHTVPDRTAR